MNLNSLMQNPYAWALLSLCTIFSVVLAIWTYLKGKRKLEISCFCNANEIVRSGKNLVADLQLLYQGKPIDNLTITRYVIWNSGNSVLNYSDIVKTKPLQIIAVDDDVEFLDATIITESDPTNKFEIEEFSNQHVKLKFDYVEKNDGIVVQLLHTGKKQSITIDCKIKGGKKVNNLNGKASKNTAHKNIIKKKKRMGIVMVVMCGILFIMSILFILSECGIIPREIIFRDSTSFENYPRLQIMDKYMNILMVPMVTIFTIISTFDILKLLYHFDIPQGLRNDIDFED